MIFFGSEFGSGPDFSDCFGSHKFFLIFFYINFIFVFPSCVLQRDISFFLGGRNEFIFLKLSIFEKSSNFISFSE